MNLHPVRISLAFFAGTFFLVLALITSVQLLTCSNLRAQEEGEPPDPTPPPEQQGVLAIPPSSPDAPIINDGVAIVTYAPNEDLTGGNEDGKADILPGLAPDQVVNVTLQFGVQKAGQTIQATALDGGVLTIPNGGLVADQNGNVAFQFQVGHDPGLYQVALRDDTHEMGVQFWVINSQAPAENPPVNLPQ
jgi:hypothetical protein